MAFDLDKLRRDGHGDFHQALSYPWWPASGGVRSQAGIVRAERRQVAEICGDRGKLRSHPGIQIVDGVLDGVTWFRLGVTVTPARSDREDTGSNSRTNANHPLLACSDNTRESLGWAGLMGRGGAGSNTATDHLAVLDAGTAPAVRPSGRPE